MEEIIGIYFLGFFLVTFHFFCFVFTYIFIPPFSINANSNLRKKGNEDFHKDCFFFLLQDNHSMQQSQYLEHMFTYVYVHINNGMLSSLVLFQLYQKLVTNWSSSFFFVRKNIKFLQKIISKKQWGKQKNKTEQELKNVDVIREEFAFGPP